MPALRVRSGFAFALAACLAALASPATGQQQWEWVSPDQSPPGTPAEVVFDADASSLTESFFDVFVHGLYWRPRTGASGEPYVELKFPGLSFFAQPGEPHLPAVQLPLALGWGAQLAELADVQVVSQWEAVPPSPCWPTPFEELDHPGTPERPAPPDPAIYNGQQPWPSGDADAPRQIARMMGGVVNAAKFRLHPVQWNPATNLLTVGVHMRYKVSHPGGAAAPGPITKDSWAVASSVFLNWAITQYFYPPNTEFWTGHYLIVTEGRYWGELMPLINQKLARGYAVTIRLLQASEIGNAAAIRNLIRNWYVGTPAWYDHYCLLVGDTNVIPLGMKGSIPTDDLYGDVDAGGTDDLDEEVWVGRLSADDDADVANQVSKWLAYMDSPFPFFNYGRDLLVANFENAPGKYQGCTETVRLYPSYAVAPTFILQYGSQAGVTNATLSAAINNGVGLVVYRGHGDTNEWWNWNLLGQSFLNAQVDALANGIAPVVWSFACTNYDAFAEDCFGEHWVEQAGTTGGVSFYGATVPSGTSANHVLTRRMHVGLFQYGFTKQGRLIEWAEAAMYDSTSSNNAWMYGLLGDPDMDVRRGMSFSISFSLPDWPWKPGQGTMSTTFQVQALDGRGQPIPGALIGAYKPGLATAKAQGETVQLAGTAEIFDNAYANANGVAVLDGAPATAGWMYLAIRLDDGSGQGSAIFDSVFVRNPTDAESFVGPLTLRAIPSITRSRTQFAFGRPLGQAGIVRVYDVAGRLVWSEAAAQGRQSVWWDGKLADGEPVPAGVYFASLQMGGITRTTRVVVMR